MTAADYLENDYKALLCVELCIYQGQVLLQHTGNMAQCVAEHVMTLCME